MLMALCGKPNAMQNAKGTSASISLLSGQEFYLQYMPQEIQQTVMTRTILMDLSSSGVRTVWI